MSDPGENIQPTSNPNDASTSQSEPTGSSPDLTPPTTLPENPEPINFSSHAYKENQGSSSSSDSGSQEIRETK